MESLFLTFTLVISVLICFLISYYVKNKKYYEYASKIPGPPAYPIVGTFFEMLKAKKGVLNYLSDCHDKYGTTVRQWLGINLYTLITDPEDVEVILKDTKNLRKSKNYDFLMPWLGKGLITSYDSHWHTHRKILTPAFHFKITDRFLEVFNERGKYLLENLSKHDGGDAFDVYPYINLYALDAIIESAMGIKLHVQECQNADYVKAVHGLTTCAHRRSFNPFFASDLIFSYSKVGQLQAKLLEIINGLNNKVLQEGKERLLLKDDSLQNNEDEFGIKKRMAFLDLLLISQNNGSGLTDQDIRDEVNTFMFAGHDTTSTGIAFTLHHLAYNKSHQEKVYEEIMEIFGDDKETEITLSHLNKTTYLDMVIKESLRLSPPIPFISRKLDVDLKLKNYTLPAKSGAAVFIYKLHRNPEIYPDPDKFDPERFSLENSSKRHPFAYVPFSAGPRNCIGQKYGQLELKSTIIKILRNYELMPGEEIKNVLSEVVLKSSDGHVIKIKKR